MPAPPVAMTTGNTMQAIFDAESGGTDFWMDRLLARPGNDPAGTWLVDGVGLAVPELDGRAVGAGVVRGDVDALAAGAG